MQSLVFALVGLLAGALVNFLADELPSRKGSKPACCPHCGRSYAPAGRRAPGWLVRRGAVCALCGSRARARQRIVLIFTALVFAYLPLVLADPADLFFVALYSAILILIIVIDLEHRLIPHMLTLPATALAILGSLFVSYTTLPLAVFGALLGFGIFFLLFLLGRLLFGPGALGFGDVTLAMAIGAMAGFPFVLVALLLGILIAGFLSLLLIVTRLRSRQSSMAYGPYLAVGALIMIVWGPEITRWTFR